MNGWQGLTYLALDLLKPFGMEYYSAIEVNSFVHSCILLLDTYFTNYDYDKNTFCYRLLSAYINTALP